MKIGFYQLGNIWIAFKGMMDKLQIETVKPVKITKKTLDYGVKNCPENACEPFKYIVGEYHDLLENGCDTIFLLDSRSESRCRIPQFVTGPKKILTSQGYKFKMITWGGRPKQETFNDFKKIRPWLTKFKWNLIQLWGIIKMSFIEWLDDYINELRAKALKDEKPKCNLLLKKGLDGINEAQTVRELRRIKKEIIKESRKIRKTRKQLPEVMIVGDLYKVVQPELNDHIFEKFGHENIIPRRSFYLSHLLRQAGKIGPFGKKSMKKRAKMAKGYLDKEFSPGNLQSIGDTLNLLKKKKIKGIIHLYSFTCMPENVMAAIYQDISQEFKVPFLNLVTEENDTGTQMATRFEAFVDLINRK